MSIQQFALRASAVLSLLLAAVPSSLAATSTAAVAVSAIVAPLCQIKSPTEHAGAERQANTMAVTCDMNVPYTVTYNDFSAAQTRAFPTMNDETGRIAATITY